MSERDRMELYEQLESWARRLAHHISARCALSRWADDIEQDVLVALWEAVRAVDGRGDPVAFVKHRVQLRARNVVKRYARWDERELTGVLDLVLGECAPD